ncbi:type IV pilus biogenesis/stability protein PilW [uncultured Paraglaciecola sp.]|uniref:type IV pilus biogenesis/stability protein PilW n=1 Tax=uncultured Paraglaciecola sp. TaxID=1765024 RepID=UPI0030DB35DC|tara:strand:+ start:11913 stop:13136 length:1224 start_codon:yes stop_codon:yes gene_type:complete
MLKFISIVLVALTLLSGCTSQNGQTYSNNFDQLKAAKTRVSLGLTYLKNGNYSQAKYNLDKALEFAPRSAEANFAMAYYYQSVSELEQAESAYQFAMDLDPKNADIANSYGAFLCQNGDYEKAKTYFLKAVNTSSYVSSAETYENLAMCSQTLGRPEDSIQYLRSAVNHQPGRASSLYLLAQSLVETQQWQEARGILRRYEKVSQISPQSLFLAMKIEQGTGNETAAKGYLDMLLKIFPNDPITQSALANRNTLSEMNNKTDTPQVLIEVDRVSPQIVELRATQKPADKVVIEPEKIDSSKSLKEDAERVKEDVAQNVGAVAEESPELVLEVEPDTSGTPALPASKAAENTSDTPEFHVVAEGENLYRISLLYNIKMQRLIDWNGLVDESAIFEGKKLSLVAPSVVE